RACFKEQNGKRHPFCGKTCATEFQKQPRPFVKTVEPDIIPGYSFDKMRGTLTNYAKRGYNDFYEIRYNVVTSIFGNFHPCKVKMKIEGKEYTFQCSEAAFQAHKFARSPHLIQEFVALDGDGAFKKARALQAHVRSDWMSENVNVMLAVLKAKFEQ